MDKLLSQLANRVQNKYYGKYRGFVSDNQDPEHRARVRLIVPSVLGEEVTGWALPCLPFGGLPDQGFFAVPEPRAQVWVEFEEGELSQPIWTGCFWQLDDEAPAELSSQEPTKRVLKTTSGHILEFEDLAGEESIRLEHSSGAKLDIDSDGTVGLTDREGAVLTLDAAASEVRLSDSNGNILTMNSTGTTVEDANGNLIEMGASGINLQGQQIALKGNLVTLAGDGGEPILKGQSFLTLFMTHIHPTGVGPSGPPIPQGEMSTLSTKVLTS